MLLSDGVLKGKRVVAKDGRAIGRVDGCQLETDGWKVVSIRVRLVSDLARELAVKKPFFSAATLHVGVESIEGVTDVAVLKLTIEELRRIVPRAEREESRAVPAARTPGSSP